MPRNTDSDKGSFLGGGPRFNQAGDNAPMPGEKVADAPEPLPFGGPRVWIGTLVVVALIVVAWILFGGDIGGTRSVGGHGNGATINGPGGTNPDSGPGGASQ